MIGRVYKNNNLIYTSPALNRGDKFDFTHHTEVEIDNELFDRPQLKGARTKKITTTIRVELQVLDKKGK